MVFKTKFKGTFFFLNTKSIKDNLIWPQKEDAYMSFKLFLTFAPLK